MKFVMGVDQKSVHATIEHRRVAITSFLVSREGKTPVLALHPTKAVVSMLFWMTTSSCTSKISLYSPLKNVDYDIEVLHVVVLGPRERQIPVFRSKSFNAPPSKHYLYYYHHCWS
jgi:hypothetical protein